MAMIDYGAIVFKNGKCVTEDMFTPMYKAVGWEDDETMLTTDMSPVGLKGMYFAYIGDKENTLAFYKECMAEVCVIEDERGSHIFKEVEFFDYNYYTWTKWKKISGESTV